jgi:hypothetical protein
LNALFARAVAQDLHDASCAHVVKPVATSQRATALAHDARFERSLVTRGLAVTRR